MRSKLFMALASSRKRAEAGILLCEMSGACYNVCIPLKETRMRFNNLVTGGDEIIKII